MVNEHGCVVYDIKGGEFFVNTTQNDSVFGQMKKQVLSVTQKASKNFADLWFSFLVKKKPHSNEQGK